MALPQLNLRAMEDVARQDADARMADYLCQTLAPVIARLPAKPEDILPFVRRTSAIASQQAYGEGRMYGFYIVASLLLGQGWMGDPFYAPVIGVLDEPGMDLNTRLSLALHRVIEERKRLQSVLPQMHDLAQEALRAQPDASALADMWPAFEAIMALRGITHDDTVLDYFEMYESDFRKRNRMAPIERKRPTGYQRLGYQHMGQRAPQPVDDLVGMAPLGVLRMTQHVLLAPAFGRYFFDNPVQVALHQALRASESVEQGNRALCAFLDWHKSLLGGVHHV